jgi:H+/Cl- antiporter ClcA
MLDLSRISKKSSSDVSLGTTGQRLCFLGILGFFLGLIGGTLAFALVRIVAFISNLALLHHIGYNLPDLSHYHPNWTLIPIALLGAGSVIIMARATPIIKGHGIPESIEVIQRHKSRIQAKTAITKPLSSAIAMGTGGPFGAEGPIIVTGAAVGSLFGQGLPVSPTERRILLSAGAAAGMAGVFGTPLAAVVLAFELLLFERSLRSLAPLMIACGVATEIHNLLISDRPLFALRHQPVLPTSQLPFFLLVGIVGGVLAILINKGLFFFEKCFAKTPMPTFSHPLIGAIGFSAIGLVVPGSLSVGYWAITDAVNNRFLAVTALILGLAKLLSWQIALASDTSGGTLAPILLIGALTGEVFGIALSRLFPSLHIFPGYFAIVSMGVVLGTSTRALFTGAIFAVEVTGTYQLLPEIFTAMVIGELITQRFLKERLMTNKLTRRNLTVEFDTKTDILRTTLAREAMRPIAGNEIASRCPTVNENEPLYRVVPLLKKTDVTVRDQFSNEIGVITAQSIVGILDSQYNDEIIEDPTLDIETIKLFFRRHRSNKKPTGENYE